MPSASDVTNRGMWPLVVHWPNTTCGSATSAMQKWATKVQIVPTRGHSNHPEGMIIFSLKITRHKTTQTIIHSSEVIKTSEEEVIKEAEVML